MGGSFSAMTRENPSLFPTNGRRKARSSASVASVKKRTFRAPPPLCAEVAWSPRYPGMAEADPAGARVTVTPAAS